MNRRPLPLQAVPRFLGMASYRVLAGGLALTLAILSAAAALMWLELRRTKNQNLQQIELLASVMELHASQVFDNVKLALDSVANNLAQEGSIPAQLQDQMSYRLQGLPFLRSIALIDPQGRVLTSTTASDRGGKVDLRRLTTAPLVDERVVIGPWVQGRSLVDGAPGTSSPARLGFIPVVRLVHLSPSASVLLVAQVNPDALATYQQQLVDAGLAGAQVLLVTRDSALLTQVGNDTLAPGSLLKDHPWFQAFLAQRQGSYGPMQTFHESNLGAWQASPHQPLVSIVEQPYAATTAQWMRSLRGPLLFMAMAVLLVGFMTLAAWRSVRAREFAQSERDAAQRETALREQELAVLFKSVQELIFRTNRHGVIRFVNARWHAVTSQPTEMARGKHLRDVVLPECRNRVDALFDPFHAPGVRMTQARMARPDGETRVLDISVVPLNDQNGQLRGFAGSAVDVTALLAAQQSLQENLDFTELVLEGSPLPICMTDIEGCFITVNHAWESFMGLPRSHVLGRRNIEFLPAHDAQVYDAHNQQLLRDGGRVRYEERLQAPEGSYRDVQVTKVLISSQQGNPVGILIVKMDITDFLAARDLAEDASRSKSEFVANISHELRTPLQSILGFSELGVLRGREHVKLAAMFGDIHAAGQRMLVLINDLLDIAKIESTVGAFHFERTDVRDLIEDVAGEFGNLLDCKQLRLTLQLPCLPLPSKVDPVRFQQVVRNVLANSVKFTPEQRSIRISADLAGEDEIHIQIQDEGPGIPPAELEAIFQAFVQSSQTRDGSGGTGLGLAICRKILAAHGGRIHAANVVDGGALFHIFLPTASCFDTMPAALA